MTFLLAQRKYSKFRIATAKVFSRQFDGRCLGYGREQHVGMSNRPFACAVDDSLSTSARNVACSSWIEYAYTDWRCEYVAEPWNDAPFLQQIVLSADGQYVYAGGSGFGMAVFDISDPDDPACLYYNPDYDCEYLVYDGERYLYVVDDSFSFAVFDMRLPASPVLTISQIRFRRHELPMRWASEPGCVSPG